jgi:hypothetical protein
VVAGGNVDVVGANVVLVVVEGGTTNVVVVAPPPSPATRSPTTTPPTSSSAPPRMARIRVCRLVDDLSWVKWFLPLGGHVVEADD